MKYQELCQKWNDGLKTKYNSDEIHNILNYLRHYLRLNSFYFDNNFHYNALELKLNQVKQGEPVQYVFGSTPFFNLEIKVDKRVLIPRPETEEWVVALLKTIPLQKKLKVLDIGTGSGCIAITIKKNRPNCHITAIDISRDAIDLAEENGRIHGCNIDFFVLDFLADKFSPAEPFDRIVSNPPYILLSEKLQMSNTILDFEPHVALFSPLHDPFIFYKKIIDFSVVHLADHGEIFVELNEFHASEIEMLFQKSLQFSRIDIFVDMAKKPRMLHAIK